MASKIRVTVEIEESKKDEFLDLVAGRCPYATVTAVRKRKAAEQSAQTTSSDRDVVGPQVSRRRFNLPNINEIHERNTDPVSVFRRTPPSVSDVSEDPTWNEQSSTATEPQPSCRYCLQTPCVVTEGRPRGPARNNNHSKRLKEYRHYYTQLNALRLWENPVYLARKEELGCHIDDIREVMPMCVVKDVRSRWPNPPHIPYMGHKRS